MMVIHDTCILSQASSSAMDSLRTSSALSLHLPPSYQRAQFVRPTPTFLYLNPATVKHSLSSSVHERATSKSRPQTALSTPPPVDATEPEADKSAPGEKFDWYAQWYPVMPLCDLDKRRPHAKRVLGIDLVVWWDRNEDAWKVMEDACPHRLAPLSEGRIDQWGRLQCVYHGWCFSGSGDCKLIPQAPADGPPVHTFKQACVAVYPSTVQHDILWVWPNSDPQYIDIIAKKRPPYMPELDDPSFTKSFGNRDISYGYEVLIENLMDPSHVPYAHYGLMQTRQPKEKKDREGGKPHEISIKKSGVDGYLAKQEIGRGMFYAPCVFYANTDPLIETDSDSVNGSLSTKETEKSAMASKPGSQRKLALIFLCVPVSPGKSRLIWVFPRNFGVWIDKVVPRWLFHIGQNLILDSDLYLLHLEEHRIAEIGGSSNWQKACFVPTKADALVVGFRKWLNIYAGGQVDWRGKFSNALPPSPPKEQIMDRYRTHTVNCSSCNAAYKALNILEVVLQIAPVALLGLLAAMKQNTMSSLKRNTIVLTAVLCFAASRWLAHFIHKNFHYHDYDHAFV